MVVEAAEFNGSRTFLLISKTALAPPPSGFCKFFCQGPDGKYFRLCRRSFLQLLNSVVVIGEQP